jgi:hypothetical protein
MFRQEWRASLWALFAYVEIGCPNEFQDFLKRHPEKSKFMLLVIPVVLKNRLIRRFKNLFRLFMPAAPTV